MDDRAGPLVGIGAYDERLIPGEFGFHVSAQLRSDGRRYYSVRSTWPVDVQIAHVSYYYGAADKAEAVERTERFVAEAQAALTALREME